MAEHFPSEPLEYFQREAPKPRPDPDIDSEEAPPLPREYPPFPSWLARRLLHGDERITWVRGPWFQPSWERYITHPGLFLFALALAAVCLLIGRLSVESSSELPALSIAAAAIIVLGSIYILAFACGYFTRLVVTNHRLLIVQGYEVRRSWSIYNLPPHLLRYGRQDGGERRPAVNLDALQSMLGGSSDQFVDAKAIRNFGKQLDRIQQRPDEQRR
jgi:hypothetical protein